MFILQFIEGALCVSEFYIADLCLNHFYINFFFFLPSEYMLGAASELFSSLVAV